MVLFDRHQNGLETHGDLPFARTSPAVRAQVNEALDVSPFCARPPGERSASPLALFIMLRAIAAGLDEPSVAKNFRRAM
jgi:hypothetical protein